MTKMEWMNRASRSAQPTNQTMNPTNSQNGHHVPENGHNHKNSTKEAFAMRHVPFAILLLSVTIVILAVTALLMITKGNPETKLVDNNKMQAVFLNGGQVYFGRIGNMNGSFLQMSDIYYLRVNQQVQPGQENKQSQQDISLVKLGCELHGPQDSMVINHDQVVFWENLKNDGQVAKAVIEYKKANPNGQNCDTKSQSTSTGTDNQTKATDNTSTPAGSAETSTTPKP